MNKEQMKEDKFKIHVNVGGFRLPLDMDIRLLGPGVTAVTTA